MIKPILHFDILDKGYLELLAFMGSDNTVVAAARVSYLGESKGDKSDKKLIRFMMKHKHTSPFEHVTFQFRIKCPLFIRSQWHRHRTWSYNEVSRRYTSENIEFYSPKEMRTESRSNKQSSSSKGMVTHLVNLTDHRYGEKDQTLEYVLNRYEESVWIIYRRLIDSGVAKEQARMVLPQSMYTEFYGTVDLYNLMHFINLRADKHAQWEIQEYARALDKCVKYVVPWTYEAWKGL